MGRRHHSIIPKLNRDSNSRKSLFRVQLKSLIEYGQITTTVTKAKIIKRLFDRLTSKAQQGTLASRRGVASDLDCPKSANRLVDLIVPNMGDRKSGFTTIQKVSVRKGDATSMATLKFIVPLPVVEKKVEKKETKVEKKVTKKAK